MGWGGEWAHFHLPLYPLYALVNRKVAIGNFPRHCSCSFDSIWLKPWQNWGSKKLSFSLGSESPQMKNDVCSNSSETTLLSPKNRPFICISNWTQKGGSVDPKVITLIWHLLLENCGDFYDCGCQVYILEKTLKKVFKCSAWIICTAWWIGISFWCMH